MHRTATVGNPPTDELGIGEFLWCLDKASKKSGYRLYFFSLEEKTLSNPKRPVIQGRLLWEKNLQ